MEQWPGIMSSVTILGTPFFKTCKSLRLWASVLLAAFTICCSSSKRGEFSGHTLRIGFDNAPPYSTIAADGSPKGLAVELIDSAAKRLQIRLQWIRVDRDAGRPEDLLNKKVVDLWPVLGIARQR